MKKYLVLLAGVAALTSFVPGSSFAQGVVLEGPGVGVRIGEPGYREGWRREDGWDRRRWRDREVRYGDGCRTITIQRDDGSMKRIRRCD